MVDKLNFRNWEGTVCSHVNVVTWGINKVNDAEHCSYTTGTTGNV
jgi:hypothetical protein